MMPIFMEFARFSCRLLADVRDFCGFVATENVNAGLSPKLNAIV